MHGKKDHRRLKLAALALAMAAVVLAPSPGLAQGEQWEVPEDYEPEDVFPPPPPAALPVGPITFDEAEFQPEGIDMSNTIINSLDGTPLDGPLHFTYTGPEATTGPGPGVTALLTRPVIRTIEFGGVYGIDFGVDVTEASIAFSLRCGAQNFGEATMTAFNSSDVMVGSTTVQGQDMGFFFIENQLSLSPGTFRRVEITFNADPECERFALDNLTYDTVPTMPTTGAAGLALLALTLLAGGALLLRRRTSI